MDEQRRVWAHWALQVASAAGATLLPARDDFAHTTFTWSDDERALVGQRLPDGRAVGLRLADLTLLVLDDGPSLPLSGRTVDEGLRWLGEQLGARLARPEHDLPPQPDVLGAGSDALAGWYALANAAVARVAEGPIRGWPHHFDLAALIALDEGGGEEARSIGVGLSPGDDSYGDPYFYVTPWPYPDGADLPALPHGRWHTEGWTGAVLVDDDDPDRVHAFLSAAIAACRELLG